MQLKNNPPSNLYVIHVTKENAKTLGRVTTGQIFNNMNLFHPEGLFSSEIFGSVGSEVRNRTFGVIELNIEVLHPIVYRTIIKLKSFYKQIVEGKVTAVFNSKTGEFEKSSEETASTGFAFLMRHIKELKFTKNESDERSFMIDLFNKVIKEDTYGMGYLLVVPAGIRDYTVDANGKPQEDELNNYYRKVLAQANLIDPVISRKSPEVYDSVAISLQNQILNLYEYIESLFDGKHKLILGKWVSRKIFNSTRNVISSYTERTNHMRDPRRLLFNNVLVGLHQFARASVPKSLYEIKNQYIRNIFVENSNTAILVNAKTLHKEEIMTSHIQKEFDKWTSSDGLEKVIASLGNLDLRDRPITLNKGKHYLGLVYRDDKYFKFLQDIDEVPEGFDKTKVTPVTLVEFLYMSLYRMDGQYPGLATRYPITGYGSIYPAFVRLTTTTETEILTELDDNWQPTTNVANNFPISNSGHFNSMVVHHSHLGALGGDHDGDMLSLTMPMADESIAEIRKLLNSKEYYVSDTGQFIFSSDTDVLSACLNYMM